MCDKLLRGMWYVNPLIYVDSFKAFTFKLTDFVQYKLKTKVPESEQITLNTPTIVLNTFEQYLSDIFSYLLTNLFNYTLVRMYFNGQIRLTVFLIAYFPFLAFFSFGIRNSYVHVYY